jgi:hypothetical protein
MAARILGVIFDRFTARIRERMLYLADGDFIGVAFLFRMEHHTIPARLDERLQTIKQGSTLLNSSGKRNGYSAKGCSVHDYTLSRSR